MMMVPTINMMMMMNDDDVVQLVALEHV